MDGRRIEESANMSELRGEPVCREVAFISRYFRVLTKSDPRLVNEPSTSNSQRERAAPSGDHVVLIIVDVYVAYVYVGRYLYLPTTNLHSTLSLSKTHFAKQNNRREHVYYVLNGSPVPFTCATSVLWRLGIVISRFSRHVRFISQINQLPNSSEDTNRVKLSNTYSVPPEFAKIE